MVDELQNHGSKVESHTMNTPEYDNAIWQQLTVSNPGYVHILGGWKETVEGKTQFHIMERYSDGPMIYVVVYSVIYPKSDPRLSTNPHMVYSDYLSTYSVENRFEGYIV